ADSGNRERGFRHIRGQDDAPQIALGTEDAFLLSLRQTRIEWEHLRAGCVVLAQGFGSLADLAFAGQEDQDIAWAVAGTFIHPIDDGIDQVAFLIPTGAGP